MDWKTKVQTDAILKQESPLFGGAVRNATSVIPQRLSPIIFAITCAENVYARPCFYSHVRLGTGVAGGYSDRCICRDAQQWRHRLAFQFLDVVLPWLWLVLTFSKTMWVSNFKIDQTVGLGSLHIATGNEVISYFRSDTNSNTIWTFIQLAMFVTISR